MKKILFNYADRGFYNSQKENSKSGIEIGGFDQVFEFNRGDLDIEFVEKNRDLLSNSRGAGLWIWKYYLALKLINDTRISEDDIIFYSDSGATFINSINPMVEVFKRDNLSVMTFLQLYPAKFFTKRDIFIITGCDEPKYRDTGLRVGGFWMFKKDEKSKKFFTDMLNYILMPEIITESASTIEPEWECYEGHSFDEALISVISKKYDFYAYRNPSQYGIDEIVNATHNEYTNESYERWLNHGGLDESTYIGSVHKYGPGKSWKAPYGGFEQYPPITFDDKSTYPTILRLHRGKDFNERL